MRLPRPAVGKAMMMVAAAPLLVGSLGPRTNFDDRLLAAQNRERLGMGVAPLAWDPALARGAAAWAEHLSRSGKFEHSPDDPRAQPEGENIWGGTPGAFLPETMVGLWISEKRNFKPGTFPNNSRSGRVEDVTHYTQLIWRESSHVGCGTSIAGKEEVMVCRYRTAGNVEGQTVL